VGELIRFLVLPPLNLLVYALLGVILAIRWRRAGLILAGLCLVLVLVLSLPVTSKLLLASLEAGLPLTPPANDPPQAIVVLGADTLAAGGGAQFGAEDGNAIGGLSLQRVRQAAVLYHRKPLPVLVTGGAGPFKVPVAVLMAQSLTEDFGVPVRWVEPNSYDTWQNASDSAPLLQQAGIHSFWLVSHGWHLRRGILAFSRYDFTITASPVLLDPPPSGRASQFVPRPSALIDSYYGLHEWIGIAWYTLRLRFAPRSS
jgi:uncharacterized SAM-binding protein YcdF (DUF218 family)